MRGEGVDVESGEGIRGGERRRRGAEHGSRSSHAFHLLRLCKGGSRGRCW